jgi:hypothetical protein
MHSSAVNLVALQHAAESWNSSLFPVQFKRQWALIQQVNSPTDQQLLRDYTERRPEAALTSVDGPAVFAA